MTISFKDFATQFEKLQLPVSANAVAASLNFVHRPISLRQVISTGAPYVPNLEGCPLPFAQQGAVIGGPGLTDFCWYDVASLPPWVAAGGSLQPGNPLRIATSWMLATWEATSTNTKGIQIINTPISRNGELNQIVYGWPQELIGNYLFQITAYNNYGSASTEIISVKITLPINPRINTNSLANNIFNIVGDGFTPGGMVQINADTGFGQPGTAIPQISVIADPLGILPPHVPVECATICAKAGGGSIAFTAQDVASGKTASPPNAPYCQS